MELATLEWVSWFNHHRLLEPIGYIPPAEAEANYWRQVANEAAQVDCATRMVVLRQKCASIKVRTSLRCRAPGPSAAAAGLIRFSRPLLTSHDMHEQTDRTSEHRQEGNPGKKTDRAA